MNDNINQIDDFAFYNCISLRNINIPESVTLIGESVFNNCLKLQFINVSKENKFYSNYDNDGILYNKNITQILYYPISNTKEKFEVPNSIISIKSFSNSSYLTTIILNNNVRIINDYTFRNCRSLKDIVIPNSVITMGKNSFQYCAKLESIKLSESLTRINEFSFDSCESLRNIIIPESVSLIFPYAFSYCTQLETISIPKGVIRIYDYSFLRCSNIKYINVSQNNNKFSNYQNDGILYNKDITKLLLYTTGSENNAFITPETVQIIGEFAFYSSQSLFTLTLGENIKTIKSSAFRNCINMKCVYFHGVNEPNVEWDAFLNVGTEIIMVPNNYIYIRSLSFLNVLSGEIADGCPDDKVITRKNNYTSRNVYVICSIFAAIIIVAILIRVVVRRLRNRINIKLLPSDPLMPHDADKN